MSDQFSTMVAWPNATASPIILNKLDVIQNQAIKMDTGAHPTLSIASIRADTKYNATPPSPPSLTVEIQPPK